MQRYALSLRKRREMELWVRLQRRGGWRQGVGRAFLTFGTARCERSICMGGGRAGLWGLGRNSRVLQRLPTTSLSGQLLRAVSSWVGAASWIPPWNGNGNGDPGIRMGRQRPLGWGVRGRAPGARQAALSLAPSSGWGAGLRPGRAAAAAGPSRS